MSLINKISGRVLTALSGTSRNGNNGGSNIAGRGIGASFDRDSVNVFQGLKSIAQAFSRSFLRVSEAVTGLDLAKESFG